MNPEFWTGKKVFLTGHTGFKGSWLSIWLHELGAEVTGFALLPPSSPNLFELANVESGMSRSIIGDIRDPMALLQAFELARPEIVIHMAAQPLVRYSYDSPVETYSTNIMGVVNLFEAIRKAPGVRAVVNVTTDKCYDNKEWIWPYRENEPMGGVDPYSSSKGCSELITTAYRNSYFSFDKKSRDGVALASARAGNVIGGGDWAKDRLIPDIFLAISKDLPIYIRNPSAIRPWQHVLEPLSGYLLLAEKLYEHGEKYAEAWNFGPDQADVRSVGWIAEYIVDFWGAGARWIIDESDHPHEASYLALDITKARMNLGWHPRWPLERSLESIIRWHQATPRDGSVRSLVVSQIKEFIDT